MMFPVKHIAAFFLLWPAAASLHAQPSPSNESVFQRPLAAQGTLMATRQEVPDDIPNKPLPPSFSYLKPAHIYRYEFFLTPLHGIKRLLWSHRICVYPPGNLWPTDIRILDADLQGDTLIVAHKEFNKTYGGTTYANIVTNASHSDRKELPFQQAEVTGDTDAVKVFVSAAKIEGAFAQKTLTLRLTNVHTFLRYVWKETQWQQVPDRSLLSAPGNSAAADSDLISTRLMNLKSVDNLATLRSFLPLLRDKRDTKYGLTINVEPPILFTRPGQDPEEYYRTHPLPLSTRPRTQYWRVCDIALLSLAKATGVNIGVPDVMTGIREHNPRLAPHNYTDSELELAYERLNAYFSAKK